MNQKRLFFMAGLQRTGATLLSSILNQNKDLWVSPASPLLQMMVKQTETYDVPANIDYPRTDSIANVIKMTPHAFYADKDVKYIIDKNINWSSPHGMHLIQTYISENVKIICPVRDIIDILVSFDAIINQMSDKSLVLMDKLVLNETIADKPMADRRAEWLMRHNNDITICINNMKHALNPAYRKMFHFVEYEDITSNPKREVEKIYDFLEIPRYNHVYENIIDITGIPEESLTGIKNLHTIRPNIEKKSRNPQNVLLPETIRRYSGMEFWRNI
jgi:sulfotransferase